MRKPKSVKALEDLGRERLSKSFFMRDFLFSDIAAIHGLDNVPDEPDVAVAAGRHLCEQLLEPLQDQFGRIAIRSAYRSQAVNDFGNRNGYKCASNEKNFGKHIWDIRDARNSLGATACIAVPSYWDVFQLEGGWQKLAWWIHDHLPYSEMYFFKAYWAFNLTWSEQPKRRIDSYADPVGTLTKPGFLNHEGSHEAAWHGIEAAFA